MRRTLRRRANTLDATHAKSVLQLHTKKEIQDLNVLQDHLNQMVSHFKKFEEHLLYCGKGKIISYIYNMSNLRALSIKLMFNPLIFGQHKI